MKLSVCMTTYNSGAYLAQALASVFAQETNFEFGIVIGDNASTDNTHDIVEHFATMYPGRVMLTVRPQNLGIGPNFVQALGEQRGEYLAFLDSDDWWIGADKLQLQVDFLEAHPNVRSASTVVV